MLCVMVPSGFTVASFSLSEYDLTFDLVLLKSHSLVRESEMLLAVSIFNMVSSLCFTISCSFCSLSTSSADTNSYSSSILISSKDSSILAFFPFFGLACSMMGSLTTSCSFSCLFLLKRSKIPNLVR